MASREEEPLLPDEMRVLIFGFARTLDLVARVRLRLVCKKAHGEDLAFHAPRAIELGFQEAVKTFTRSIVIYHQLDDRRSQVSVTGVIRGKKAIAYRHLYFAGADIFRQCREWISLPYIEPDTLFISMNPGDIQTMITGNRLDYSLLFDPVKHQ